MQLLLVLNSSTWWFMIDLSKEKAKFWSDSMLTLLCIQNQSHRFGFYVANRVSQILESSSNNWKFVEGVKNPADVYWRGVLHPMQLLKTNKHWQNWLSVPEFLINSNNLQKHLQPLTLSKKTFSYTFNSWKLVKDNKSWVGCFKQALINYNFLYKHVENLTCKRTDVHITNNMIQQYKLY